MANQKYALLGATGSVGKSLVPVLFRNQIPFKVIGRSLEKLQKEFGSYEPLVEYHAVDLSDTEALTRVLEGVHTAFYLAGVPYTDFSLHPQLTASALDAAQKAGVQRFVHLSTVYPYGIPRTHRVSEEHPREPNTFKGRMRKEQEDLVIQADGKNGLRTTILRPPDFYGPGAQLSYVYSVFEAALKGTSANVIGPVDTPHEFIFVPDLADTLWQLSNQEEAFGHSWNIGGTQAITTRDFIEQVFSQAGRKPKYRVAGGFLLRVMGLFSPFMREVQEMHYLWTSPVILDDQKIARLLPDLKKTSYADGIRLTLASMRAESDSGA